MSKNKNKRTNLYKRYLCSRCSRASIFCRLARCKNSFLPGLWDSRAQDTWETWEAASSLGWTCTPQWGLCHTEPCIPCNCCIGNMKYLNVSMVSRVNFHVRHWFGHGRCKCQHECDNQQNSDHCDWICLCITLELPTLLMSNGQLAKNKLSNK